MELTLKRLLEHAEFKKYRGKGYDPTEVDDFLDKAAAMAGKVEVQLTQALEQAKAGGGPSASPADIDAEVERRVAERMAAMPAPAPAASAPNEVEIAEEARRTLTLAQRTADAAVKEAREDAERIVAEASERAGAAVEAATAEAATARADADAYVQATRAEVEAEATRERREARQRLASEISELEGIREDLRGDVGILERHVEEQRSQLGSTIAELQQILDDPSGFRMAPEPALSDPALPDFSDLTEATAVSEPEPAVDEAPDEEDEAPEVAPSSEVDREDPEAAAADSPPAAVVEPAEVARPDDDSLGSDAAPAGPSVGEVDADVATGQTLAADADESWADARPRGEEPRDDAVASVDAPSDVRPISFVAEINEVDHAAPGVLDLGPPTAPVSAIEPDESEEDAFLAELRKAISDEEPLGPRDDVLGSGPDPLFGDEDRRGWRFGRRN
ncbi:MAG: DivIVA domain-containing protein [Acidimicrobiales bacterium]|nr:DivIVA domain-containing protein [Acidimicrobiales bacterium]